MRKHAEQTDVPISKSRAAIQRLLEDWGVRGVAWSDDFDRDMVTLRFVWNFKRADGSTLPLQARFEVRLPSRAELEPAATDKRTRKVSEVKLRKLLEGRGRREHRVLLLWLKGALNAVEEKMVRPEVLFLPFLEGRDGQTVADVATPMLERLTAGGASLLLGAGGGR